MCRVCEPTGALWQRKLGPMMKSPTSMRGVTQSAMPDASRSLVPDAARPAARRRAGNSRPSMANPGGQSVPEAVGQGNNC